MKNKSLKGVCILIVLALVFALAAGCARQPVQEDPVVKPPAAEEKPVEKLVVEEEKFPEPGNPQLPLVTGEHTITVWSQISAAQAEVLEGSFANNEYFKELEKRTGIRVEFTHPTIGRE